MRACLTALAERSEAQRRDKDLAKVGDSFFQCHADADGQRSRASSPLFCFHHLFFQNLLDPHAALDQGDLTFRAALRETWPRAWSILAVLFSPERMRSNE